METGPIDKERSFQSELANRANQFAAKAHGEKLRKTGDSREIDHVREVAGLVEDAGFEQQVVTAALLHDTVEDTGTTNEEIQRFFGSHVADLVAAMTDNREISDYRERKQEHRERIAKKGLPAAAIYASDKLANIRSLRRSYAEQGEALSETFSARLDVKEEQYGLDLEMLEGLNPQPPYLAELREQIAAFRADRRARSA